MLTGKTEGFAMSRIPMLAAAILVPGLAGTATRAGEPLDLDKVQAALDRALVRVQSAAENYPSRRDCFSCHHQTLPVAAMVAARRAGADIDAGLLAATVEFSADSLRTRFEDLRRGSGIGGRAMTVSYGLWTFREPDRPADDLSEVMVSFLLKTQEADGRWTANSNRPPLEDSEVMATVLSALGLDRYATPDQRPEAGKAIDSARNWLGSVKPVSQEDRNARLWGLWSLEAGDCRWMEASREALAAQRPDGGWSQRDDMCSDAYATGQTLALLHLTGLPSDDRQFVSGIRYLLDSQEPDGSWRVETRSRPVQEFFDNGDPHGRSQFLSTAATCWAAIALAGALEGP